MRQSDTLKLDLNLGRNADFAHLVSRDQPPKNVATPFSGEIRAGKNSYVYAAHTYHTKVPPQGIEALIEFYTSPNGTVLDPFCGSGMTGIAATRTGRKALLSDLSPAACFIARNLNTPADAGTYWSAVRSLLRKAALLEVELYSTTCRACGESVPMHYTVWSFGVICPHCGKEFVFWDAGRDEREDVKESKILSELDCPYCSGHVKKRELKRTIPYAVQVGYKCCRRGQQRSADVLNEKDLQVLEEIERNGVPTSLWYPKTAFPDGINARQPIAAGITTVDRAYTTRALYAMAFLWNEAAKWPERTMRDKLLFTLTSLYKRVTVFSEFRFRSGSGNTANYNVPFVMKEQNVFRNFLSKAETISRYFREATGSRPQVAVSTQSACSLTQIPDKSIDYVFTDPPFGGNINYSEMNFLWESWLNVWTETKDEAIVNSYQGKGVEEYEALLCDAFKECRRVLKDAAWLTVVFHNSSDVVWAALQKALLNAGFSIEGTQTFDKEQGTFKQSVSENAVGYDLVLHCQKATGAASPHLRPKDELVIEAAQFIQARLSSSPEKYCLQFLQVNRAEEADYRKLYAEWLASSVGRTVVSLSFEEFRSAVAKAPLGLRRAPAQPLPASNT